MIRIHNSNIIKGRKINILKLAYPYKNELNKIWQSVIFQDRYKYYNFTNYWYYEIEVNSDSWNNIQMVSVDENNNILGYLSAKLDRTANKVSNVGAVRFSQPSFIFTEDFDTYFRDLFEKFNFNKIEWCVGIGNPAEKKYDNIIDIYGGRIIGIQHESTVLMDGTYCDVKEYEIFKRDYLKAITK